MRGALALAALALSLILSGCGGGSSTAPTDASSQTLAPATRLPDLEHPDRSATLFSHFNADQGVPRLVLLVSPTCPTCLTGASWVRRHILERYPTAKLHVYAIWIPVLAGDNKTAWDKDVLDDPRVTQLWDAQQIVGSWLQAHGGAFWDTFLIYGPDTRWDSEPEGSLASGSPIIGATDELEQGLLPLIGKR